MSDDDSSGSESRLDLHELIADLKRRKYNIENKLRFLFHLKRRCVNKDLLEKLTKTSNYMQESMLNLVARCGSPILATGPESIVRGLRRIADDIAKKADRLEKEYVFDCGDKAIGETQSKGDRKECTGRR